MNEDKLTILGINALSPSPASAKIDVRNDRLVAEVVSNVTIRVWEISSGLSPTAWIRRSPNIARDGISGELPHPDTSAPQLHSHDSASITIKRASECGFVGTSIDTTASILIGTIDTRTLKGLSSLLALHTHAAAGGSVKCHLVVVLSDNINGFHNVNLSIRRPVTRVGKPESRPSTTTQRGMFDIEDEKIVKSILLL